MKFIRDIISERRSQKPAERALPESAVLPPLADQPPRRATPAPTLGDGPLPLPQRQAEPTRTNIFAEADPTEDFAGPDDLDATLALALADEPAGHSGMADAHDDSAPVGGYAPDDPFDRLRGASPDPRPGLHPELRPELHAEAPAFASQRALRLERPILSPREPASLARSPFAETARGAMPWGADPGTAGEGAEDRVAAPPSQDAHGAEARRAEPRWPEPRQPDLRQPEPRQPEPRAAMAAPEPRFESEPPLRRPAAPDHRAAAPSRPPVEPAMPQPAVTARAGTGIEDESAFEVPPPAAGRGANRSGRVKTRLLGFNPDGMGLADPFEKPQAKADPAFPVAWLVVVSGPGRGAAFSLHDGVSRIGRGEDQTVPLAFGDTSISRENHAAIAYDAEQNAFFVGQSGKANIVRLNNKPLLSTEQLKSGDQIRLGETTLRFVALCGPEFDWNRQG